MAKYFPLFVVIAGLLIVFSCCGGFFTGYICGSRPDEAMAASLVKTTASKNNARCIACGREFRITEEHRGNVSGQIKEYRCPQCGVSVPAQILYQFYDEMHPKN
jgi:predicted RNA-binding Zn-ribbon protein involved in translation (DUF1610 family)